jgi:glycosyltransferase involved in cell wall biosynthesis
VHSSRLGGCHRGAEFRLYSITLSTIESAAGRVKRVAFSIAGDPRDPSIYSGAPASLLSAFAELGMSLEIINTEFTPALQRLLVKIMTFGFLDPCRVAREAVGDRGLRLAFRDNKPKLLPSREMAAIRSAVAAWRLRHVAPVDRVIQFGSEYRLPPGTDYVTLDDATIIQLRRSYPYPWMTAVSEVALKRMIARQRQIFRGARACCVLSEWAARSVIGDYGVPASRVHVVGTGPNRRLDRVERDWSTPRFLFVGSDFERKNGDRVLTAFERVRLLHPRATLDVVGSPPMIASAGVTAHGLLRLDVPREVAELNSLFARATCLVMPSLLEPTGNVHAEALAAGIGSIGTTSGGVDTVIGDAGVTVSPYDTDEITSRMLAFCVPDQAQEYGRRARERARLFTWQAVAKRVMRAMGQPDAGAEDI